MKTLWCCILLLMCVPICEGQAAPTPTPSDELAKAHDALEHDRAVEAIAILQRLALAASPVKGVQHELGLAYYRTGKLTEAQHAFAQATKDDAADMESVQMEGLVLYRLNQPLAAIPYLERVRQWMPNANTDANYVLGLCYVSAQRYDDARRSFAVQFEEQPDSAAAYLLLATMLRHANLAEAAAVQAEKALQISPNLPLAHFMLGEIALYKSNVEQAVVELEAERKINPNYAPTYDRLGDAYLRQDKVDEAQQALTKAISLDRSSTGPFIQMGKVLLRRQDAQTATMYLKHAEKMDPANFMTHTLLAQAFHRTGQEAEAKREADLAARIHSDNDLKLEPVK